ncbi:MAG: IS630 family transposase [Ktedonobacteraceae bacterium]|nr:IS630 family transposase [Ktedonobacteraceae bacterium]
MATRDAEDHRPLLIMAQDEGRFGRISRPRSCWVPSGVRPLAPSQVIRESLYAFTAVAPSTGELCSLVLPHANTEMMNVFLEHVSKTFSKYLIVMQVDQAGWHQAKALVIPENIRLIPQPPYPPEVNPVEHIWDDIREKYFHNRIFPSLDILTNILCHALNELADDPQRVKSMTNFPHLQIVL